MHALCQPGAPQRGWEAQSARARRVVPPNWTTTGTESRHPNCRVETESRRLRTKWSAEKQNRWASHNPQVKVRKRKTTRWRDTTLLPAPPNAPFFVDFAIQEVGEMKTRETRRGEQHIQTPIDHPLFAPQNEPSCQGQPEPLRLHPDALATSDDYADFYYVLGL